jgi:NNP family nitrate/nitrite transporter-like MFS transporter
MPAIFDSLVHKQGLTPHVAWRVSFVVPFILITVTGIGMLFLTEDTPTGSWADRGKPIAAASHSSTIVSTTGGLQDSLAAPTGSISFYDDKNVVTNSADIESGTGEVRILDEVQHEVIQKPSFKEAAKVAFSLQTLMLCCGYVCSFGGELAINSILGTYYLKNFPYLGQTTSGRWAAMFGLLNVISRPAGGFIGDLIYKWTNGNLWAKKFWIHFVGVVAGVLLIIIGKLDPHNQDTMFGLIAVMAIFLEAGNGANFALVPHIHPHANGKSFFPLSFDTRADRSQRYPLRSRRRVGQPRRCYFRYHLSLQRCALRAHVLDYGHCHDHLEHGICLGAPHSQGADWWSLMMLRCSVSVALFLRLIL